MNKFKALAISIFSLLSFTTTTYVNASVQEKDKIVFNGKEYDIFPYLLESYFSKHPEKKPNLRVKASNLDRGYMAKFKIIDDVLYLIDIMVLDKFESSEKPKTHYVSVFQDIFPYHEKLKISWESGILELPYGDLINSYSLPNPTYSNYWILDLKKGKLKEARNYSLKELNEFKERQFNEFKKTRDYKKLTKCFQKTKPRKIIGNEMEWFIRKRILLYSKKFMSK